MNNADERKNDVYDKAYFLVRDTMPENEPFSREEFLLEFLGDKKNWTNKDDVAQMKNLKEAINLRAKKFAENWRIFYSNMYSGGAYLKLSKGNMVRTETWQRVNYIASGLGMVKKNIRPMVAAKELDPRDKRLIKEMSAVSDGAKLAIAGSISQMRALTNNQKRLLISRLDTAFDPFNEFFTDADGEPGGESPENFLDDSSGMRL